MPSLIYHVPEARTRAELVRVAADCGFLDLLGRGLTFCAAETGPSGTAGAYASRWEEAVGWYPEQQLWHECAEGRFWLGLVGQPGPEQLRRPGIDLAGHWVELGDGNQWHLPCALQLPRTLRLHPDGSLVSERKAPFQAFCAEVERLWLLYIGAAPPADPDNPYGMADADWYRLIAQALGFCYYVDHWVCSALGLFSTDLLQLRAAPGDGLLSPPWRPLEAIFDVPGFQEMVQDLKKKRPAAASNSSGSGVEVIR